MSNLLICLSLMASSHFAYGAPRARAGETYKSVIQRAQAFTLKQDRKLAAKVLVEALEKEPRDTRAYKELKKTLNDLGEIFYTEKAQKIFESGRSLVATDQSAAIDRFREALELEPGNIRVMRESSRGLLLKGDCKKSLEITKEAMLLNPFNAELLLLRLQSKACLGQVEDFEAELSNPFVDRSEVAIYLDLLRAQALYSEEKYEQARDLLETIKKRDAKFPETYLWLGRLRQKMGTSAEAEYREYLSLCRDATVSGRLKHELEPRTCKDAPAVEKIYESIKADAT